MLFLSCIRFLFLWKALRIHASFSFEVIKSTSSSKRAILLLLATVNNAWREVNISTNYSFPSFSLGSSPSDNQLQSRRERGTQSQWSREVVERINLYMQESQTMCKFVPETGKFPFVFLKIPLNQMELTWNYLIVQVESETLLLFSEIGYVFRGNVLIIEY